MQKIWEVAKLRLTADEIKNEIFLRTDYEGKNPGNLHHLGQTLYNAENMGVGLRETKNRGDKM